jgi:phosphoglycolate phosphatase
VAQTLKSLLAAGTLMAVATNKAEAIAVDLTQKLGIDSCFAVVVGAESVTHHKPDPEALRLILGRLGVKSGCALMVGDTAADILAGKRARTMTCAALYGYGTRSEVEAAEPDFSVFPSRRSLG